MEAGVVAVLFWSCVVLLVYTYFGYPALLALPGRRGGPELSAEGPLASVSVIVAAYNEEACITKKIKNLLGHDYPEDRLEVLVVSDGSTDQTEALVAGFADPQVRLLVQPVRQGKNMALNRGARDAFGEILIFTDANAMLAPGALRRLVAPFRDPDVGLVSGQGLYGTLGDGTAQVVSNAYVRYESFIKQREAAFGFVAAADGALYAIRRAFYTELRTNQVHDLLHPIQVALMGHRSVFEPEAFTVEPPSSSSGNEFRRHVRIIAQGFLVLLTQTPVLLASGRLKELWMLISHRLLRWTSSLFLAGTLAANAALFGSHPVYTLCLAGQVTFYGLAAAGAIGERLRVRFRLLAVPYYFCLVSAAGLNGFFHFVRGRGHTSWVPTGGR